MTVFQKLHQPTGRLVYNNGEEYLFFGGTAYLGLLDNPDYIQLYKKGIDIYGLNNGTSRSNNVQLGIYNEAEYRLATRFGFADAALLSSGYLAAQVAVKALSPGREVIYAPGAHPALWLDTAFEDSRRFVEWRDETINYINQSVQKEFVIISNTLDNLTPGFYDFSPFATQCDPVKHLLFILDDSHGLGVVKRDAVSLDLGFAADLDNIDVVIVASLAKGMGTDAGVVMGPVDCVKQIKKHPIFRGASPPAPAAIYALINGDDLYHQAFDILHRNIEFLGLRVKASPRLSCINGFPVFTSNDPHLYRYLLHKHVLISSFPYPFSNSPLLNRIVISSLHKEEDLQYLAEMYFIKPE